MVLHLLGKKSWNVYGSEVIERVRRDEVEAQAREEVSEQRMQEEDAARRTAILRGEAIPELRESAADDPNDTQRAKRSRDADGVILGRKRRKLRGEDDTERDIRFAYEDAEAGRKAKQTLVRKGVEDAPLVDHAGHLQLIPAPDEKATRRAEKNAEVEAEKAKKRKREEDQVTMRFSNAAGFRNGVKKPWYASKKLYGSAENPPTAVVLAAVDEKDVWGNADPLRKAREGNRISSSDPFAAMQQAQRQLKQSGKDRERWYKERMSELEELNVADDEAKRRRKHGRRRESTDSMEDFSLDATIEKRHSRHSEEGEKSHRQRRHRSRSRSREKSSRRR
ncbi:hypothetical protein LTR08_005792 [Meristemomyces frigidus]|nr:hypothetical protein LTR08_005792 [Meristemomyces frigidus]